MNEETEVKTSVENEQSNGQNEKNNTKPSSKETQNNSTEVESSPPNEPHEIKSEDKDGAEDNPAAKKKKSKLPFAIAGAVFLIAAIGGLFYWLHARKYEATDDAFIDGDIVQINPKVSAYVSKVYVKANQQVHKGDLLLELNTQDFEARLEQAKAQLHTAQAQKNQSRANVALTRKTSQASQTQAASNVETARNNVQQTALASDAKESQIAQATSAVKTAQANLAQTRAQIPQAQANLNLAQKEFERRRILYNNGDISKQSLDQATATLQTAQAQLDAAQKQVLAAQSKVNEAQANVSVAQDSYRQSVAQINLTKSQVNESAGRLQEANAAPEKIAVSESQVGTADATIEQAQAAVHQAELDLSYTKIYAPEDGYIAKKNVEEGQLVQVGMPLMAIALSDDIWVVANFKETQLELMRVGQPVEIKVDAYPNEVFEGRVDSFQVGTGSRFSVLPTENATGNYVKVVQRIPVKIVFNQKPDNLHLIAPGMSVEPEVKVR
jgi:membrane fusion protein (multidrug efflux system)